MISLAQLQANRDNAQKSTGPRSQSGKDRSRENSLIHGLRAEVLELPEERGAIAARVAAWVESERPEKDVDHWLIARAAKASVRLDRCTDIEADRIDARAKQAEDDWADEQVARARRLGNRLRRNKPAVEELRSFGAGCDLLIRRWTTLGAKLDEPGAVWTLMDSTLCYHLLGVHGRPATPDAQAEAAFADHKALERNPDDDAARGRLRALVAEHLAELAAHRVAVRRSDAASLAAAIRLSRFDDSAAASKMQRYESSHAADLHRNLRELDRRRKSSAAPNEPIPAAPNEPNLPPPSPEQPSAAIPIPATPNEPIPAAPPAPNEPNPAAPDQPRSGAQPMTPQPNPTAPTRNLSPSGWRARLVFDPAVSERWPVVPGTQITAWDAYVSIELNTQPIGVFVERHHGRVDHLGVVDLLKAAEELIARARARREPLPELDRPH